MTQEDKELLLKDLCSRLPYGVRMKGVNEDFELSISTSPKRLSYVLNSADFKPYLRPMSSMTEEEAKEYLVMLNDIDKSGLMNQNFITKVVDWLDKKMFDHRGLIPKGLALEASEGTYNN